MAIRYCCVLLSFFFAGGVFADSSEKEDSESGAVLEVPSLPHLRMDAEARVIDIDATVCLHEGMLELVACTVGTKEHESVVAIKALPKHVHLMLVLLGVKPGGPARMVPIDEEKTRWRDIPARGHPIDVSLVYTDASGEAIETPIEQFLQNSSSKAFPSSTFLFTGSGIHVVEGQTGVYLADQSGNFISISNFGDEVLGRSESFSHANEDLLWKVRGEGLPEIGEDVILRLRPQKLLVENEEGGESGVEEARDGGGER